MKDKSWISAVRIIIVFTMLLIGWGAKPALAASLSLDKTNYGSGEQINVNFSPSTGTERTAWIAVIPSSIAHGDGDLADEYDSTYFWVTSYPNGVGKLWAPNNSGSYDVRYFSKDPGGIELASVSFTVGAVTTASVSLNKNSYSPGEKIEVIFSPATGVSSSAWIGVIPSVIAHGDGDLADKYDFGYEWVKNHPNGTLQLNAPKTPGSYDIRFFDNDPKGVELASASFIVSGTATSSSGTSSTLPSIKPSTIILQIDNPSIQVNGSTKTIDSPATIVNGRTLVPLRAIFEALGASLQWDPATQSITATRGDQTLKLVVGSNTALNNNSPVQLDTPPQIINGFTMVPLRFVGESLGEQVGWDASTRQVSISTGTTSITPISTVKLTPSRIHEIILAAHQQFTQFTQVNKLSPADAVSKQMSVLKLKPEIDLVENLTNSYNLKVRFKDGYELIMFQDEPGTLGSTSPFNRPEETGTIRIGQLNSQLGDAPKLNLDRIDPNFGYQPPSPYSSKALIFDAVSDNRYQDPLLDNKLSSFLSNMGYGVNLWVKDFADLQSAAAIDDRNFGLVYISSHGGVVDGDFFFMVRPYYSSPPPADSGYTGTRIGCVDNGFGGISYVYLVGSKFAQTYWTNRFPGTIFVVNSCHSADPQGLSSLPTWTIDFGASAWLGWDDSVLFIDADKTSIQFFYQLENWKTVDEATSIANSQLNSYAPEFKLLVPVGQSGNIQIPHYTFDAHEPEYSGGRNFCAFKIEKYDGDMYASVYFYNICSSSEFYIYFDNNNDGKSDTTLKCTPSTVEVYSIGSDGKATLSASAVPRINRTCYSMIVPWDIVFGQGGVNRFNLLESSDKTATGDRLPDSGWVIP